MALAFNQDCLLPDQLPFPIKKDEDYIHEASMPSCYPHQHCGCLMSNNTLIDFTIMTRHMRRYIRYIRQDTLPDVYDELTRDTVAWWDSVQDKNIHLANCYYSMRLVLVFYLLQYEQSYLVTFDLLLDSLDVTLRLLQGLQELKLRGCDQSTYHHMFFAIHQTLKCILTHIRSDRSFHCLETFAKQQFQMNLCVLEGTNAFVDDIYQMRSIGANIVSDMHQLGFMDHEDQNRQTQYVFRLKAV
ncbi:hypothetical protein A0J61_08931 [Choanephora cucurbitarum]|uniref:Uncharacterized protein n=1 Tax=Choanephora cucurbitarum TaxID=101091 RepID=A0A1C7N203_9FUNG|nr:hypothetical protein A0J61_08931 [Choanephora cucurbitarum]